LNSHKFVISAEGIAVVEKPAGKATSTTDFTVNTDELLLTFDIGDRTQAGSSTSLRFAQKTSVP